MNKKKKFSVEYTPTLFYGEEEIEAETEEEAMQIYCAVSSSYKNNDPGDASKEWEIHEIDDEDEDEDEEEE